MSWGRPFDFGRIVREYDEFCEPIRKVVQLVADAGGTQEFALFSGPRLAGVTALDAVVLLGDASHPLSGAYGAGAGFALEDGYVLSKALEWTWRREKPLTEALKFFDDIRSPHYNALYDTLDWIGSVFKEVAAEGLPRDREIEEKVLRTSVKKASWMYDYDIKEVVDDFFAQQDKAQ